ncbi:MAG: tRNA uridine-5-carboxymethylaminomethyl(34) synthesis GTPase MnmE [Treponema sp.]|jgi:tRNA modification GTPase|nr:tRNA uridine-5-carboxymethylaminomethyl(34) synthesis GTPase MnmE [Treponema sp.]
MSSPSYGDQDPIAALATPPGESALAVIRTSGNSAVDIVSTIFSRPKKAKNAVGNSVIHGWIHDPSTGKKIDEVLLSVYRAPKSYTGEDGADISCHGGIAVAKELMSILKKAGFREALPGEFTFRAFMNGKLDLTRAESVMELVSAKTNKGREQAVRRLSGVLADEINEIKALLVQVLAATEISLDYSEDEVEVKTSMDDEAAGRLPDSQFAKSAAGRLKHLSELWQQERIYAEGALAVLAGRPNAGKSSLFNYLIRDDRSIVTDTPGTTRDWIEAMISLEGIPLRLADTAGLRNLVPESQDPSDTDEAERIGIKRSLELMGMADLILYVIDGTEGITGDDREFMHKYGEISLLFIWNKSDLARPPTQIEELSGQLAVVSSKTGEGIQDLIHRMSGFLEKKPCTLGDYALGTGPGTVRQKELIDTAYASVEGALALSSRGEPLDIIAPLFRTAIDALGEITGEVSNADILETMFSRFCVGK